ncbi:MAG TPA: sigma-70 family RNA polymerase sigma factor [Terriglobales bacterium]|nr:sigma-70 family RNA polymerase sigma factor [Terriglobales bacterium]
MKAATQTAHEVSWSNDRLVAECLKGNQEAWSGLIDKYKNLIFSVPLKFGLSREDAADVFQSVCLDLLTDLPQLREPKALPKWLMQASFHKCLRWKRQRLTLADDVPESEAPVEAATAAEELPEEILFQLEREHTVREAIAMLPARCHRMITMLFFEDPPRPYEQVAQELGIATGSIGFIRGRCLQRLRKQLEEGGFE